MPPDLTSLTNAATVVITSFNNPGPNDYAQLLKQMEPNVVLKRVLFPDSVQGIGNVTGYLNYHMFVRNPKLVNLNAVAPPYTGNLIQIPADAQNATSGQVTGTGTYLDNNNVTATNINFTLGFVRKSTGDQWSLLSAFATLI